MAGVPTALLASSIQRLLVLGDSLSAEYGLSRGSGWVALLEQRLAAENRGWQVVNASISGETTAGGKSRLGALLKAHQPAVVVIELGGNDALRGLSLDSTRQNLQAMISASQQSGARVLLLGMQVPPNYGPDYSRQFSDMFAQLAQKNQVRRVPFFLQGLTEGAEIHQWFQADRIHPNAQAQPRLLDNVWPELKKLL
ncbi:MAG: arylesterase [Alphaproteobacteria bacterium]|nr:arylesterase [Alphaproteobacteria bacterium]